MTTPPLEPTPRTPRAEVRQRLIAAAGDLFAEHGYVAVRLDDIARAAGFTKGAVYSNFGSKQGLFAAVLTSRSEAERARLLAIDDGATQPELLASVVAGEITGDTQRGRLGVEFAARAAYDDDVAEAWRDLRREQRRVAEEAVTEVTSKGGRGLATSPRVAALILHCLTNGLSVEHLADPDDVDEHTVREAVTTAVRLLLTDPQPDEVS